MSKTKTFWAIISIEEAVVVLVEMQIGSSFDLKRQIKRSSGNLFRKT